MRESVFEAFYIPTRNMNPTILEGDRVLVNKLVQRRRFPQRGDLVVFRNPSPVGGEIFHSRIVALAGDTIPCPGLDTLTSGADAYVQTVIRDDIVEAIPVARMQDILDYHSYVSQAGETAARNGVKRLILTHMVPAPQPDQYDEWVAMAAKEFDGEIFIGDDLLTVTI